jgi:TnpA family transposase
MVPVRSVNTGPNPRYFGQGRGVTYLNYTSDQFTGLGGLVIPGTIRDSVYVLEALLEQESGLTPTEIMSDSGSYSDLMFGLFWCLGYQFSPRLAELREARFWRMDPTTDYGPLNGLARHRINTNLIATNWDDILRVAGSLKVGTVHASTLVQALQRGGCPTTLGRAIAELGRVPKTLHLLNYIDDEYYRRRIQTQLNRGEGRHSLARHVFHGQRGELRQRYRQGQEDQLGALGLVVNIIVLWNTWYMQEALSELRAGARSPARGCGTIGSPAFPTYQCPRKIPLHPSRSRCPGPPSPSPATLLVRRAFLSSLRESSDLFGLCSYSDFLFQLWANPILNPLWSLVA